MLRKIIYNLSLMLVFSSLSYGQESHPNGATFLEDPFQVSVYDNLTRNPNTSDPTYGNYGIYFGGGYKIFRTVYPGPANNILHIGSGNKHLVISQDKMAFGKADALLRYDAYGIVFSSSLNVKGKVKFNKSVGIGTDLRNNNPNNYKLAVNGKIGAKEIVVENTSGTWGDYVFTKSYDLPSLKEVENYIDKNHHLPGVPSADSIAAKGISVGEMTNIQMKKIEELTRYVINMKKEIKELKEQNKRLRKRLKALKD